ncbi:FMN-dependent NADH-azoreductase [Bradyrhizobium sp. 83002]|uniref:FMN-dependent NADH-azoreductase n=1 Tax=Bradyrhizobium aeschynomenes TaxID=2734909 RepID=UPI0015573217|nr:NAD(P)H-dependent oxidoreductase [Bradyrhizobium aeschynomenes]NPU09694.1 FMN-dependent NADH-azoreductase [Bradyrhizobium aeschynomenes]
MEKILYIKASPRGNESKSTAIADAYLAELRERIPALLVDTLDLSAERLPEFDGDKVAAKIAVLIGQAHQGRQKTAWDEITGIANRFIEADRYLMAVPMWNGGIPYRLKQFIDLIHQPGLLWGLDPQTGYFGLLKNKKAVLTLTSGAFGASMPSPAFGIDHHSTYLCDWLNQAGVTDITTIRFQPTLLNPDPAGAFEAAVAEAIFLAGRE